jgi:hypothetical protein
MSHGEVAGYIYFMEHAGLTKIGHSYYPYGTRCAMSGRLRLYAHTPRAAIKNTRNIVRDVGRLGLYAHAPTGTCSGLSSPACSP